MSNAFDQLRAPDVTDEVSHNLDELLPKQLAEMKLPHGKVPIARRGLAAVYVNMAKALNAHEMGRNDEEIKCREKASKEFVEMIGLLETP